MGQLGYWILLFDGYSSGLVLKNPRFHSEGVDIYGQPMNWWVWDKTEKDSEAVLEKHGLKETVETGIIVVWDDV